MERKVKRGAVVKPMLYLEPRTRQQVLFTSIGTVYHLTYLDRLRLRFGLLDVKKLDAKAVQAFKSTKEVPEHETSAASPPSDRPSLY